MGPDAADLAAYADFAESGRLTLRISAAPPELQWADQAKLGIRRGFGTPFFKLGAVKGFADGHLVRRPPTSSSPTPTRRQPGACSPDEMIPIEGMRERLTAADAAGLQLCVHAIGDEAISVVLDLFAGVTKANGARDRPVPASSTPSTLRERLRSVRSARRHRRRSALPRHRRRAVGRAADWPGADQDHLRVADLSRQARRAGAGLGLAVAPSIRSSASMPP